MFNEAMFREILLPSSDNVHSLQPPYPHTPLFEGGGWKFRPEAERGGAWVEIFEKGVKEWEREAALKKGGLEEK